jgi:hypothetical protein
MRKFDGLPFLLILVALTTVLCACPPLNHKIFVRNLSDDTARLKLIYKAPFDTISNRNIEVRAANDIVPIKKKSFSRLNDTFIASADSGRVILIVPPKSTVFVSDILNSFYMFADKSLVIEHAGNSDTMTANYPYKQLEGFKRKPDPSYNYFYRTVVYYDIK